MVFTFFRLTFLFKGSGTSFMVNEPGGNVFFGRSAQLQDDVNVANGVIRGGSAIVNFFRRFLFNLRRSIILWLFASMQQRENLGTNGTLDTKNGWNKSLLYKNGSNQPPFNLLFPNNPPDLRPWHGRWRSLLLYPPSLFPK